MKNKKKKEKITYIDDGRTIADMRATKKDNTKEIYGMPKRESSFGDKMKTFFGAMRSMVLPMCIVLTLMLIFYFGLKLLAGQ